MKEKDKFAVDNEKQKEERVKSAKADFHINKIIKIQKPR